MCSASRREDNFRSKTDPYYRDIWEQIGKEPVGISSREKGWEWLGMKVVSHMQVQKHLCSFLKCQKMHEPLPFTLQIVEEMRADMRNAFR